MPSSRLDPYELVGTTLWERFSVEAFVGFAPASAVYRGTQIDSERPVTVRLLKVRPSLAPNRQAAVLRRLRALSAPLGDVVQACSTFAAVLDVGSLTTTEKGEKHWMPVIIQSSVAGETLQTLLTADRARNAPPKSLTTVIDCLTPLADALAHAHAHGIMHGGIAPQSIIVQRDLAAKVLDLGIAPALSELQSSEQTFDPTSTLSFFDPAYASPEHFGSLRAGRLALNPASDVFSLALVVLELLTSRPPLGEGDAGKLEAKALDSAVRPTPRAGGRELGSYVDAVFERALAVRASDRHASVESFWSALRAASRLTLRPSRSVTPPPIPRVGPPPLPGVTPPPLPGAVASPSNAPASTRGATTPTLAEASIARASARRATEQGTTPPPSKPTRAPAASQTDAKEAASEDDDLAGEIIAGKYAVERVLGRGGMGTVWLCTHLGLGERVAVKVMSRKMANDDEVRARFEREARASARIKSRYVARVHDTGTLDDRRPFIVMECMEGETLSEALRREQTISLADTVRIVGQVGRGLARAHELGIVHRDIKPENVFLAHTADDGVIAKLFDFGIVKVVTDADTDGATRMGVLVGTPHYMSPEQADGLPIDKRSDIYSLGVMAFRMLSGKRPFQGESVMQILMKICSAPLPKLSDHVPSVSPAVDEWFRRTCARNREERFGSALECVEALARAAGVEFGRESLLPPPPEAARSTPPEAARSTVVTPSSGSSGCEPHEWSCPTLLDDEPEANAEQFEQSYPAVQRDVEMARELARTTNPLFDVTERSIAPTAVGQDSGGANASRRAPRFRHVLRRALAFSGFVALGAIGALSFVRGPGYIASGAEAKGVLTPDPLPALQLAPPPRAAPPAVVSANVAPAATIAPSPTTSTNAANALDAGAPLTRRPLPSNARRPSVPR